MRTCFLRECQVSPRDARFAAAIPRLRSLTRVIALAYVSGCVAAARPSSAPTPPGGEAAYRIYDSQGRPVEGLSALVSALRGVDVVFVGEQHDDATAHRFEHDLLRALGSGGRPVTLALEMFERDVQPALSAYLAGTLPEAQFLQTARPWPNYASDYRPLVEWAREQGWPVIGSNVPRSMAAAVAQRGLAALDSMDARQRAFAARELQCPEDAYFQRFSREMQHHSGSHGAGGAAETAPMIRRLYEAQCIKDETMAEAILEAHGGNRMVVHVNGAFHSDYGHGIVSRLQRRRPEVKTAVVSLIPADNVNDPGAAARHRGVADYVVLTSAPTAKRPPARGSRAISH